MPPRKKRLAPLMADNKSDDIQEVLQIEPEVTNPDVASLPLDSLRLDASGVLIDDSMFFVPSLHELRNRGNPYRNENYRDRFHWKWDKKYNRLM